MHISVWWRLVWEEEFKDKCVPEDGLNGLYNCVCERVHTSLHISVFL